MILDLPCKQMPMAHLAYVDRKLFVGFAKQTFRMLKQLAILQIVWLSLESRKSYLKKAR